MTDSRHAQGSTREEIGLVGIGLVGEALAEHLIGAGFGVVGCDIDPARRAVLKALGGIAVERPVEIAQRCRRIFLALMTSKIVGDVIEGSDGLLSTPARPQFIIDTSTGDPIPTEAMAKRLAGKKIGYLDAPISGSSQQIRDGKGVFMVGGDDGSFAACRDLLGVIGEKIIHVGPSGSGARAKLATNLILGLNRMALAEGLVFAERLGLDLPAFLDLVRETPAYSVAVDAKGEKMLNEDFSPQAKVSQHHKDLSLILDHAERLGQELPLSRAHRDVLGGLMDRGDGDLDVSAVIKALRNSG
jgi:3-hydroxyisobutyrate dehydrogenase